MPVAMPFLSTSPSVLPSSGICLNWNLANWGGSGGRVAVSIVVRSTSCSGVTLFFGSIEIILISISMNPAL